MNRYVYDGATIAALPNCFLSNAAWCSTFSATEKLVDSFLAAPQEGHTNRTKLRQLILVQRTCTVQCLFLHCAPSARLIVVTKVRGPEGQASGGSWRAL